MNKKIHILILLFVFAAITGGSAFAEEPENSISNYEVIVRINTDGSLNITENIKYASLTGYNNVAIFIDKQVDEEIEINNVYMLDSNGYIECTEISQEQWDINAFMGTYSITEESGFLRLKVYGRFYADNGTVVVQYTVRNAIKRYNDVADYKRIHIFKDQNTYISNIDISVYLPMETSTGFIKPFLHGVLVGNKSIENNRIINFHIPDIVPKEYVEVRVVFPENLVFNSLYTAQSAKISDILQEEEEYNNSDKSDLLKARESAANKAGRRAMAEKLARRARITFSIISFISSAIGVYVFIKIHRKLRKLKKIPVPEDLSQIEKLTPAEVRFVISRGRTGARGLMASLMHLVSLGALEVRFAPSRYIRSEYSRDIVTFKIKKDFKANLSLSEKYLHDWIASVNQKYGEFNPDILWENAKRTGDAKKIKTLYDEWTRYVQKEYFDKNLLEINLLFYRNLGIIIGAVLFFSGCIVPVAFSIWMGYLMLPVGIILFLYSSGMQKYTDYSATQYTVWKEVKNRFQKRSIDPNSLPEWMQERTALLAYAIALRMEKDPTVLKEIFISKENNMIKSQENQNKNLLSDTIKQTLHVMNIALSSVQ
ncbi:MAG: DUF2207 domain-containing protein, partial [Clostridiaceae bacterium]|nr:DUF2207 domain-containing protein [Clostridiaceae bacterium]